MKKLSLLLFLGILPLLHADDSIKSSINTYSFSKELTTAAGTNAAWQIYNDSTTVSKTIYVEKVEIGSAGAATYTMYSTTTAFGFTGGKTGQSATSMDISKGSSISSCTYSSAATVPTGNTIWEAVAAASTTVSGLPPHAVIAIRPGYVLYVVRSNAALAYGYINFYFREEYAP